MEGESRLLTRTHNSIEISNILIKYWLLKLTLRQTQKNRFFFFGCFQIEEEEIIKGLLSCCNVQV